MLTQILKMSVIKNKRGFSLPEFISVLVITAVLVLASFFTYQSYKKQTRRINAQTELGGILSQAEAFKATAGFFLPNLAKMNISFKGLLEYGYSLICEDNKGVIYDSSRTCGSFAQNSCAYDCSNDDKASCWMGFVLCQTFSAPLTEKKIHCRSSLNKELYQIKGRFKNVLVFKDLCKETEASEDKQNRDSKFQVKDSYGLCPTVNREIEMIGKGLSCAHSKNYALPLKDLEKIYKNENTSNFKTKNLISGPHRLVVTAMGCQKSQSEGCSHANPYHIMSLSSAGRIYNERWNQKDSQ